MRATLIHRVHRRLREDAFFEIVVWQVPAPVRASAHRFKYRLALVVNEECVMRYDNEAGKGDHKHIGQVEVPYKFINVDKLLDDFADDVTRWFNENA